MKPKRLCSALPALILLCALLPGSALGAELNDPEGSMQWALEAVNARDAWDLVPPDAGTMTVAVLDNGFSLDHEDLADSYYRDGNGQIVQYDAVDDDFAVAPADHGTHVAGIVAAAANNETGVAGIAFNHAKILPVQVLSSLDGSGTMGSILRGYRFVLDYAAAHPEANIRVVNLSLDILWNDVYGAAAGELIDCINEAYQMGILTVIAAGNDADSSQGAAYMSYPIDWAENAVGVIAVEQSAAGGEPARIEWSNYNTPGRRTKDLSAPGGEILSTVWYGDRENENYGRNGYDRRSGTSQAAPCVSGAAALLFAANPQLSAAEVREILCATARPIHGETYVDGFSPEYGYGMLDAAAALRAAAVWLRGSDSLAADGAAALVPVCLDGERDPAGWSWSSSDPSVASVSGDGVVTGVSAGETVITAASGDMTAAKRVTVYDAAFTGAEEAMLGETLRFSFSPEPVRDGWILSVDPEGAADISVSATVGDGGAVWLFPKAAGRITLTATLSTNESIRATHTVEVSPADLSGAEIRVENQVWRGAAIEPTPTVVLRRSVPEEAGLPYTEYTWDLAQDIDYTVSCEDNINAGTATLTVRGSGSFTGEASTGFLIRKDRITESDVMVSIPAPCRYDGTAHTPGVVVICDGWRLTEGTDYAVEYRDNVAAGQGSVVVQGIGSYAGTVTRSFRIEPMDIADEQIEIRRIRNQPYAQGERLKPAVTVTDHRLDAWAKPTVTVGDKRRDAESNLLPGRDFEVAYENNAGPGTASATVTGIGNYTGTLTIPFVISDKVIVSRDIVFKAPEAGFVANGYPYEPAFTVTYGDEVLTEGTDYRIVSAYEDNVDAGEGGIWIEIIGDYAGWYCPEQNGYSKVRGTFTIAPAVDQAKGEEKRETPSAAYSDVAADVWYASAVAFVTEAGLFEGFGDGTFGPELPMDRAMAVQVLWKLAGKPGAGPPAPFDDVTDGDWFAGAVRWACAAGVTKGTGARFAPHAPVTREQFAEMAYRYVRLRGEDAEDLRSFRLDFPDADSVSDWALEGVSWLVMKGILKGMDGELNPQGVLTRAQTAALLQRVAALPDA